MKRDINRQILQKIGLEQKQLKSLEADSANISRTNVNQQLKTYVSIIYDLLVQLMGHYTLKALSKCKILGGT